jgi:cytoskeletal protein CcmA (bactofilin family)
VTGQTTANGALVVNSTANITGATTVSSLTMTGPTVANGTLVVNNTANVTGATTLGSLAVTNNSVLTGTLRVNNSATVTGATTLGSLTVNGGSVLGGAVTFNNGFTSANGANFGSTTNISNLNVTNNATVQNNLTVRLIELGPLSNQTVIQQAQITMKNFQTNQLIGQVNVSNFSGDTLILSNFAQVNTAVNTPLISSMALRISSINGLPPNQATLAPNIAVSSITVNGQINSVDNSNTINWQGAASISTLTVTGNEQVNGNRSQRMMV